jgi:hypothetical protein
MGEIVQHIFSSRYLTYSHVSMLYTEPTHLHRRLLMYQGTVTSLAGTMHVPRSKDLALTCKEMCLYLITYDVDADIVHCWH